MSTTQPITIERVENSGLVEPVVETVETANAVWIITRRETCHGVLRPCPVISYVVYRTRGEDLEQTDVCADLQLARNIVEIRASLAE